MITRVRVCGPGISELVVSSYDGQIATVPIPGEPRDEAVIKEVPGECRPLAIRFDLHGDRPACTVVVTSPAGPRRLELSNPAGLALVASGVHGIVTNAPVRHGRAAREGER
jgi:hypothetical protein